ncbi:MAG: AAA family ATPase [Deltaproteobacteria bacterium]|nr:AAA family ATPase [Deltaproteobacteria bacterium]
MCADLSKYVKIDNMKCPVCQLENPEQMNFCGHCGSPLPVRCHQCGQDNPLGTEFCGFCGATLPLSSLPAHLKPPSRDYTPLFLKQEILRVPGSVEGERKMVSVLFADVAGFTRMSEGLDPEDVHEIMDGCFDILGREIHGAGGSINQYTGDGVMALFGAPVALEDHVERACYAALRVQDRMEGYTALVQKNYGVRFQLRIGISTGKVVVGAIGIDLRLDYTASGDTTNLAARLQTLAQPGGILVSERVKKAAELFFRFRRAGEFAVKGKKDPVLAYTLMGEIRSVHLSKRAGYRLAPFVDRKDELSTMKTAFEEALRGRPRLLSVEGEAGVGKSRLLSAFRNSIADENLLFLKGHCRPYGEATALYPLAQTLRSYFHLSEKDSFDTVQEKIRTRLKDRSLVPKVQKVFRLFSRLIEGGDQSHTSSEGERRTLFQAVADLISAILAVRPLVLAFDDMQWADETTRGFLSYLVQAKIKGPLLIICLGRTVPREWCPAVPHHFIGLASLPQEPAMKIFSSVLGTDRLDPRILRRIVSKAGGNPLFLVGMAETLRQKELVVCDAAKCTLILSVEDLEIPDDIREVLTARLDALPELGKRVAQLASVIGGEFSYNLLGEILKDDEILKQGLELLEKEGVVEKISSDLGGKYLFRHQMMQEISYHSLLRRNRRQYHRLIGDAMERIYRDSLSNQAGFLAFHYYHAQDWSRALEYTLEAGHIARRSFACREALLCFDRALDILQRSRLEKNIRRSLQIYKWKGGLHFCLGQKVKSRAAFHQMYTRAKGVGDHGAEAEALFRLGWISFYMHHPRAAQGFLNRAINLSREKSLKEVLLKSVSFQGFVYSVLGRLKEARPLLIQSLDLSDDATDLESRAWCLSYLIQYYNWTGEFKEALAICEELEALNHKIESPFFHIVLHFRKGLIYGALGRLDEAREVLKQGLDHLDIEDENFWRPRFLNTLAWVHCEAGETKGALDLNRQALEEALPTGNTETIHNAEINLGENHLRLGNMDEARKVLEGVWGRVKRPGISYVRWRYKTRLLMALSELYEKTGKRKMAVDFANRALRMARDKGSKKHEAGALHLKARALRRTRPNMARRYLDEALGLSSSIGTRILSERIRRDREYGKKGLSGGQDFRPT